MAKQRYINTKFWEDCYISDLDPIEKLIFLYFLTNPATNIIGAYELPLKRMAVDTGIDKDMLKKILDRFEQDKKIFYKKGWVIISNFVKHQNTNSPKIQAGIKAEMQNIPDYLIPYIYGMDTVSHSNTNSNTNSNGKFIPPKPAEVDSYILEIKAKGFDGEQFCSFYASKGWMVGKNKMVDWKQAVQTWKKNKQNNNKDTVEEIIKRNNERYGNGKS